MKISSCFLVVFIFICLSARTQEQSPYNSSGKKIEKKILKSARKQYDLGNYMSAVQKYSDLLKIDSTNPLYNNEIAHAYYDNFRQPLSIPYFERAIRYSKDTLGEAYFFLASAYHLAGQYELAQKNYALYLNLLLLHGSYVGVQEKFDVAEDVKRRIEMCDNGKLLSQSPASTFLIGNKSRPFEIRSLGKNINSEYDDYDAVLTGNDSVMYFTSRRDSTTGGGMDWDDKYFEDIYISKAQKNNWTQCIGIGAPVNTNKHDAVISVSPDGKTIYLYRGNKQGTFYFSNLINGKWTNPAILSEHSDINTKAWETSFYGFIKSKSDLYVVSDRAGGLGGRDIYVSHVTDSTWSPLENIGAPINTPYNEDCPYISADGNTMYFSSSGHNSIGGFDIFQSHKVNGKWSEPENLGVPFNSPGDDVFFVPANTADRFYYSSSTHAKDSTCDMDIYVLDICDEDPTVLLAGRVIGIPDAVLTITGKESGKSMEAVIVKGGQYSVKLEGGKEYVFTFKTSSVEPVSTDIIIPKQCRKYEMYQEFVFTQPGQPLVVKNALLDIKTEAGNLSYSDFLAKADKKDLDGYSEVTLNTTPVMVVSVDTVKKVTGQDTTLAIKTTISFNNVLFDFGKSKIDRSFMPELDKAVALLKNKDYKNTKFEVAGYTDSKGKDSYNMGLSKRRAAAVANYLALKGIKRNRMKIVGYGETRPIAANENADGSDNPEGRAKNRRTEIVILK